VGRRKSQRMFGGIAFRGFVDGDGEEIVGTN
jgi:hypothetical protein